MFTPLLVSLQVITSIGELVEMCSPQILSGWRPLFSALRTVHGSKTDTKDYLLGEYSMGTSEEPFPNVLIRQAGTRQPFPAETIQMKSSEFLVSCPCREVPGAGV